MANYYWRPQFEGLITKKNLLTVLARNRGLVKPSQIESFLRPDLTPFFDLKLADIKKAVDLINQSIQRDEKIIVYADYDADGICGAAILWETLKDAGAHVMPYIPHRLTEGYGLSKAAIEKLAAEGVKLIITVDNGVSAGHQIDFAQKLGVKIVVTDHHLMPKNKPTPDALVHTAQLCGAGVAFKLAYEFAKTKRMEDAVLEKIDLVAIATLADLMPLTGINRSLVVFGLRQLNKTERLGLKLLMNNLGLKMGEIDTWQVSFLIVPRINAAGRLTDGIEALRLLCTGNERLARHLVEKLVATNHLRQELTHQAINEAKSLLDHSLPIGVVVGDNWHYGVLGLVASRLVDEFAKPIVVISKNGQIARGSARSVRGFNIVEAIKQCGDYLIEVGGHEMAAGFSMESTLVEVFSQQLIDVVSNKLSPSFEQELIIEGETVLSEVDFDFLEILNQFKPFGLKNPEPLFLLNRIEVAEVGAVGSENQHLKLRLGGVNGVGFGLGEKRVSIRPGDLVNLVFTPIENEWNGNRSIELKIKDLKIWGELF